MKQLAVMLHLKKFYEQEIKKLQGVVVRLEHYIDQGIQFRREVADSAETLRKAVAELNEKIEAEQRGEDVADDWWRGTGAD